MSDGVTVITRVCLGVMGATVGGHQTKRISRNHLIEEYDRHPGGLNNGVRRTYTWNTARLAEECRVQFALVPCEFLNLLDQLGLVRRLIRISKSRSSSVVAPPDARVRRPETAHWGIRPSAARPKTIEVRMAVGESSYRLSGRLSVCLLSGASGFLLAGGWHRSDA